MILETLKTVLVPIHKEGYPFIFIALVVTALAFWGWVPAGWICVIITCWMFYFFRDPERFVPEKEGLIVSPADGVVCLMENVVPPAELELGDEPLMRVSIFLNIFNVHVNRVPVEGEIIAAHYHPGAFFNASMDKASEENERQLCTVQTSINDKKVGFIQIAGLIARRIVCDLSVGDQVLTGQRFGLIRFGSRTDVFLPKGTNSLVTIGQQMVGGETVIADLKSREKARGARKD